MASSKKFRRSPQHQRLRARASKPSVNNEKHLAAYLKRLTSAYPHRQNAIQETCEGIRKCELQMQLAEQRITHASLALDRLIDRNLRTERRIALTWKAVPPARPGQWTVTGASAPVWRIVTKIDGTLTYTHLLTAKGASRPATKAELSKLIHPEKLAYALELRKEIESARADRAIAARRLWKVARHIFGPGAIVPGYDIDAERKLATLERGRRQRAATVEDLIGRIKRLMALVERCEVQLNDLMQHFNQMGPYGFRTFVVRWRVLTPEKYQLGSIRGPCWAVIWRHKPVIGLRPGVRVLKEISSPTREDVRAGQLGKYAAKLFKLRNAIERKAKRRKRWLRRLMAAKKALRFV